MATAIVLSDPAGMSSASVWRAHPAPVIRGGAIPASEPCAIIHLIHPDAEAAARMAASWSAADARTRIHPHVSAFEDAAPPDAPGCLIIHLRYAADDAQARASDHPMPDTRLPTIITTDRADVREAVLAMKAGAVDFFEAPLCERDLGEAVADAIRIDRMRRERDARRDALLARFATLTRREREVMVLVARGLLNKQVAGDLTLSEVTVKVHRGSAMRKMGARTLADLVRMADIISGIEEIPRTRPS